MGCDAKRCGARRIVRTGMAAAATRRGAASAPGESALEALGGKRLNTGPVVRSRRLEIIAVSSMNRR